MIEYRIDTHFNGVVKAYLLSSKRVGTWPFRRWVKVHEEKLYEGRSVKEAQAAIDAQVVYERGSEVKSRSYRNARGEEEIECW